MSGLQTGGVDRRQGDPLALARGLDSLVQKRVGQAETQQSPGGFLQGCEVRHVRKIKRSAQVGAVLEDCDDASVVRLMEYLQDQTNDQLRLREALGTEFVAV